MEPWQLLAHQHWFTFRAFGSELRLCSRCSGYLTGFLFSTAFHTRIIDFQAIQAIPIQHQFIFYVLFAMPLILDWLTQSWGLRESNNIMRFITGAILGMGVSLYFASGFLPDLKALLFVSIAFTVSIIGLIGNKTKSTRLTLK
jgi:uncharacterized membrane protein